MINDPRVVVNLVSWPSHKFKFDGERLFGLTAVNWDDKRERAYGYGMNRSHAPIGRTAGKYTPGAVKLTLHRHTWKLILAHLRDKAPDGRSYGNVMVDAILQVEEGDVQSTVEFRDCVVTTKNGKAEESADPNMVEIELSVMRIIEDGATLYDSSEEPA